ncbi:hypothetical protein ACFL4J_01190, partial [Candidatus Margulisiibacteriota bacterium]
MAGTLREIRIRNSFREAVRTHTRFWGMTRNRSAASAIENTLKHKNPDISLNGLLKGQGKPRSALKCLEIGCESLDPAKAAALAGIRRYDVNSVEMITLRPVAQHMRELAELEVQELLGDMQHLYFKADYDFIIAKSMAWLLLEQGEEISAGHFLRLVHGNARYERPKRVYFFDKPGLHEEGRPLFDMLEKGGFKMREIRPSSSWMGMIAEMKAVPGKLEIKPPRGRFYMESVP